VGMDLTDLGLDWHDWFERWEAMQNCYVPRRMDRFEIMLKLPGLPRETEVRILDLGCGPGSLSFFASQRYPNACILAVDFDPVLLAMGQQIARGTTAHVEFKQVDIREGEWWKAHRSEFDLVVSATALHWLNAEHLVQAFQRTYEVLKPGGWLLNSDHAASEHPQIQDLYREMLQQKRQAAFRATKADDWSGFWEALGRAVAQLDLAALRNANHFWEGTDDGQPKVFHLTALQKCGFEQVDAYWQDLGEAVIGGRRPSAM
jgi:trans-aconitate methyltransferase